MLRYITVGLQTNRGDQTKNPALFDHIKVNMICAKFNTESYPKDGFSLSLPIHQVAQAYRDVAAFSTKLCELNELITDSDVSPMELRGLYPLVTFDVTK